MDKILIVDGSGLLFQSFFGMPNKIQNKRGEYIEAVICFSSIIIKLINEINPTKLLVVFDGENKLERKEIDQDYKSNRPTFDNVEDKDNPFLQLNSIKKFLNHLDITNIETVDEEADDYIASFVNQNKLNNQIYIQTSDKDFYQLIDDNVVVYTYRGKASLILNNKLVKEKYGFDAKFFATYKALVGDPSDNIKGINGIGDKTAKNLIIENGDINKIIENSKNKQDKLSIKINSNIQKLLNNYKIINLLDNKKSTIKIEKLIYNKPKKSSIKILEDLDIK